MKAKLLKNGTYNFSGVTLEEIVAIKKMLQFADKAQCAYEHRPEEIRSQIDALRADGETISLADTFRFFCQFIEDTHNK